MTRLQAGRGGLGRILPACRLLSLAAACGLAACSSISRTVCLDPDGPNQISITVDEQANLNRAVAVTLVFATDETVAAEIAKLSAHDFFARQIQLLRDHPGALHVTSWELAPGQSVINQSIDAPCASYAALVFVDYATPGEHRTRVDGITKLSLVLGTADFTASTANVMPGGPGEAGNPAEASD
jgi:type VI secretion system protein